MRSFLLNCFVNLFLSQLPSVLWALDKGVEHSQVADLQLNEIAVVDVLLTQPVVADTYKQNRATGAFIVIDRLTNITVGAGMVINPLTAVEQTAKTNFSEFEVELNALIRKHFPHWGARDISDLLK